VSEARGIQSDIQASVEFQYDDERHQSDTTAAGMWLFLATETLFFGGLFLVWLTYRYQFPQGFADAARHAEFGIGTANTVILMTASAAYSCAVPAARLSHNRVVFWLCVTAILLGILFMSLKGYEWKQDLDEGLVPGPGFSMGQPAVRGAGLFWIFYYISTTLHMLHLLIGVGLVSWIAQRSRRGEFGPTNFVAVEIVGLYWSFVDLIWMVLYALIYLAPIRS